MVALAAGYPICSAMKITAAVLRANTGPFSVEEVTLEAPRPDEVLVRVVSSGLCHTDSLVRAMPDFLAGGHPTVFGHEGAGIVESVGKSVTSLAPGDHVVMCPTSCHQCPPCRQNRPGYCFCFMPLNMCGGRADGTSTLTDSQGGRVNSHFLSQSAFATHVVTHETCCVKVDPLYDLARLGPLSCGIQTGAGAVLNILRVVPGSSLVVLGSGSLGLSAVMAAKYAGAKAIIAVDRHQNRLDLAIKCGATHVVRVADEGVAGQSAGDASLACTLADCTARVKEITEGIGADYAFDTTGHTPLIRAVYDGLNCTGTMAVAGVGAGEISVPILAVMAGRSLVGVMQGGADPHTFIPLLAKLNAEGKFPFEQLITPFKLEQINEAEFATFTGQVVKPVFIF
eukprot:jgi/Mesvir1/13386/Mv16480-RA.1